MQNVHFKFFIALLKYHYCKCFLIACLKFQYFISKFKPDFNNLILKTLLPKPNLTQIIGYIKNSLLTILVTHYWYVLLATCCFYITCIHCCNVPQEKRQLMFSPNLQVQLYDYLKDLIRMIATIQYQMCIDSLDR